jgi:hypothetical protein
MPTVVRRAPKSIGKRPIRGRGDSSYNRMWSPNWDIWQAHN